jgi:CheY-like chemotaxis protein
VNHSTSVSYINDIYLVLILLLSLSLIFGYFYFIKKLREHKEILEEKASLQRLKASASQKRVPQQKASFHPPKVKNAPKNTLPVLKEAFQETKNITLDDFHRFRGGRILIVEDNKINQKILVSVLKRSGIILQIANNGREALNYLNSGDDFDLVLMDIKMPIMDGYTATQKIREKHRFDQLPIVALTVFSMGKEINRMFELGINGYMTKPLNNNQLYTVLHTFLGNVEREIPLIEQLNMEGLDIDIGIANTEGDIKQYKQALREFILLNSWLIEAMPKWIEEKDYDHVRNNCANLSTKLSSLGAYELDELVARMKKLFIYNTQHRVIEFKEIFPDTLQKLIHAMKTYIEYPV